MKNYHRFITFIVFFTFGFFYLNNQLNSTLKSASFISIIIFGLFLLWNHYLWKIKSKSIPLIGKVLGFFNYPNLNGKWKTTFNSTYKEDSESENSGVGNIIIKQNYSSLSIKGDFEKSSFESFTAFLKEKEDGSWFLIYGYRNKPIDIELSNKLHGGMHEGFCWLDVTNEQKLTGFYSNDINRMTCGTIELNKNIV